LTLQLFDNNALVVAENDLSSSQLVDNNVLVIIGSVWLLLLVICAVWLSLRMQLGIATISCFKGIVFKIPFSFKCCDHLSG
jgi:hypothetical protein